MGDKRLYLIDATAFCYRAFYALGNLSTSFGQPTNAVYGFINMLNKILKERKPQYLAACFDVSRDTFRKKKFAEYKIQRPPMPEGLSGQIPLIKQALSAYGIAILEKEGFEADDIIATIAHRASARGLSVTVVSSDKDMLQLVDKEVTVFSPYQEAGTLYDEKKVLERFGVPASVIPDIIALMGDASDNIPNVPGIGEVSARELIQKFGSLDALLANRGQIKQNKIKEALESNLDTIRLNRELAVLDKNVNIDFDPDRLKIAQPDYRELFRLFKRLEFKKFLKGLPAQDNIEEIEVTHISDSRLRDLIAEDGEIILWGQALEEMIFCAGKKIFCLDKAGPNIKSILADAKIKKIGHDLKKTRVALAKVSPARASPTGDDIILQGMYFDTMIAAYLLNPSRPKYELADIALDYLDSPYAAGEIGKEKAISWVAQLKPILENQLREKNLLELFSSLEMPLAEVLSEMELCGIKINSAVLAELSRDIETRLVKLIADIYALAGCQFNINSPKQLREVLFEKLKLPVSKKSKTGPSTNEEVLRNLSGRHKLPALLLEYRQLTKLKNTYIDILPGLIDKHTGRIHTSFNQTATETGRLSSSNPNLQNIPIKTDIGSAIRRAIIAGGKNDYLLVSCDYSQVELRLLAHLAHDENLIAAFGEDKDIHKITASLIYGLEEKDITQQMRETAKRVNFGIVYGLTSFGLSRDLGISLEEAQNFIDAYFLRYPRVKEYIEREIRKAEQEGFVVTLLGRRRYIPEINNKNQGIRQFAQRQAVNTPIQGSASDLIKLAMIHIHQELKQKKLKSRMVMQIHDELVFEAPEGELGDLIKLAKEKMEHVLELAVPIKVDIKKGKNWLDMEPV